LLDTESFENTVGTSKRINFIDMFLHVQPQTENNGKRMSKPYVPHGMERIKLSKSSLHVQMQLQTCGQKKYCK